MVTADGASESVPSVVSRAIEWVPEHWKAEPDSTADIARIGKHLVLDADAGAEGFEALLHYDERGILEWKDWVM
jgi:hypothetical protein